MPLTDKRSPFSGGKMNVSAAAIKAAANELRPGRFPARSGEFPTAQEVGLTDEMMMALMPRHGLVIAGGATGMGKTSTLAALIRDHIRGGAGARRIIEVCHGVEPFSDVMTEPGGVLSRMIVGAHVTSLADGVRSALRRRPDIILVSELLDGETVTAAAEAASGHLVYATAHGGSAIETVRRQIMRLQHDGNSAQASTREFLTSLRAVVHNRIDRPTGVMRRELLVLTDEIRSVLISLPMADWEAALSPFVKTSTAGLGDMSGRAALAARAAVAAALSVHAHENGGAAETELCEEAEAFVARLAVALLRFPSGTHAERLEMISRAFGFRGWHAAQGRRARPADG